LKPTSIYDTLQFPHTFRTLGIKSCQWQTARLVRYEERLHPNYFVIDFVVIIRLSRGLISREASCCGRIGVESQRHAAVIVDSACGFVDGECYWWTIAVASAEYFLGDLRGVAEDSAVVGHAAAVLGCCCVRIAIVDRAGEEADASIFADFVESCMVASV